MSLQSLAQERVQMDGAKGAGSTAAAAVSGRVTPQVKERPARRPRHQAKVQQLDLGGICTGPCGQEGR